MTVADEQIGTLGQLTQRAAAWLIGLSDRQLRNLLGVPRNHNKTYDAQKLVAWYATKLAREDAASSGDGDVDDGSNDSPELRRQRLARAMLYELELGKKRGELVEVDRAKEVIARHADVWNRFGLWLTKMYGPEAQQALERALDDCQRIADQEFGPDDGDLSPDEQGGPGTVQVLEATGESPDDPDDLPVGRR